MLLGGWFGMSLAIIGFTTTIPPTFGDLGSFGLVLPGVEGLLPGGVIFVP